MLRFPDKEGIACKVNRSAEEYRIEKGVASRMVKQLLFSFFSKETF